MSLILKGIDLPEEEETISLMIEPDGTVSFYVWDSTENDKLTSFGRTDAIQIPKGHGRLADMDELNRRMYHEAFETDTIFQRWDSGCWIRYKLFEILRDSLPTILEGENE